MNNEERITNNDVGPDHGDCDLRCGDCFDFLPTIPDGSVDLVLTDPPYGITACSWDVVPDIPRFWREAWRVLKPNGAAVIFGTVKNGVDWITASRKEFRYDLVWNKRNPVGFLDANRKPLRVHEMVFVFYRKLPVFNPQFTKGEPYKKPDNKQTDNYGKYNPHKCNNPTGNRFPLSLLTIRATPRTSVNHPTEKPVELMEWLVKTYSNEGETVLDPFMGSGSTGVACVQTGRKFLGSELDPHFFEVARRRITDAPRPPENGEVVRGKPNDPQEYLTFGESEGEA